MKKLACVFAIGAAALFAVALNVTAMDFGYDYPAVKYFALVYTILLGVLLWVDREKLSLLLLDREQAHAVTVSAGSLPRAAGVAGCRMDSGIAVVGTAGDHPHAWQQRSQSAHRGRFAGAPVAENEHSSYARIDGGDQDRQLHFVLSDDRGERKDHSQHLKPEPVAPLSHLSE